MDTTIKKIGRQIVGAALIAVAGFCLAPASRAADEASGSASTGSNVLFMGGDVTADYGYPYIGLLHHFSGSITDDGFLLRVFGFYAPYSYKTTAVPGGNVDGDAAAFDVMGGYQKVFPGFTLRGLFGPEFENDDLSPDNRFDKNRGADGGAKVQGEFETNYDTPYYGNLVGSFGTAKHRYWTRVRAGYDFSQLIVGPEGYAIGNQSFDEQRAGAFVTVKNLGPVWLSVGAGYSHKASSHGGDSPYGTLEVSTTF